MTYLGLSMAVKLCRGRLASDSVGKAAGTVQGSADPISRHSLGTHCSVIIMETQVPASQHGCNKYRAAVALFIN